MPCVKIDEPVRELYFKKVKATVTAIIAHIEKSNDTLIDLRVERPFLEERFLELTKAGVAPMKVCR